MKLFRKIILLFIFIIIVIGLGLFINYSFAENYYKAAHPMAKDRDSKGYENNGIHEIEKDSSEKNQAQMLKLVQTAGNHKKIDMITNEYIEDAKLKNIKSANDVWIELYKNDQSEIIKAKDFWMNEQQFKTYAQFSFPWFGSSAEIYGVVVGSGTNEIYFKTKSNSAPLYFPHSGLYKLTIYTQGGGTYSWGKFYANFIIREKKKIEEREIKLDLLKEETGHDLSTAIEVAGSTNNIKITFEEGNKSDLDIFIEKGVVQFYAKKPGKYKVLIQNNNIKSTYYSSGDRFTITVKDPNGPGADDWIDDFKNDLDKFLESLKEKLEDSTSLAPSTINPYKYPLEDEFKLVEIGNRIVGPIQVIGSLVSVITIIIIGIKYMLGSVEEKTKYKETLMPYFIGAIIVFGITNILSIIYNFAINI